MIKSALPNVFVQVNTIRGYRFLDECGKIMNEFDEDFPTKGILSDNLGPQTLNMTSSIGTIRHVRVSTQAIWLHFEEPDTTQYVIDQGTKIIERVAAIIGVTHFNRVAIRMQHIFSDPDDKNLMHRARERFFSGQSASLFYLNERETSDSSGFEFTVPIVAGDLSVNMQVGTAQRDLANDLDNNGTERVLMVDSDIYRRGEFSFGEHRRFLRGATSWASTMISAIMHTVEVEHS